MEEKLIVELDFEEMEKAGLHLGHKTSKTHPKMEPFLAGIKGPIHVLNLQKTKETFFQALLKLKELYQQGKTILFVGTPFHIKKELEPFCQKFGFPYQVERWVGGTITNFSEIKKRIEFLKELEKLRESEDFKKYTKKEQREIEEKIQKLNKKFGGLRNLDELPDAVFVFEPKKDHGAIKEAKRKGILRFAVCDTNCDPTEVDFPIVASNNSFSAVRYILKKIEEVLGKKDNGS